MGTITARTSPADRASRLGRKSPAVAVLIVATVALEVVVAAALVREPVLVAVLLLAAGATLVALLRPPLMATIAWLSLVLVPVYAAPKVGPINGYAAVAAFWLVAIGAGAALRSRGGTLRASAIDISMGLFIFSAALSGVIGARLPVEFLSLAFVAVGCYLGMRLLFASELDPAWLIKRFVLAGAVVLPFVAYEAMTGTNVFFGLVLNSAEGDLWATTQERLGSHRVEASFGHAIALGMFLASASLFCLAMASRRRRTLERWVLLAGAGAFALAIVPTVSRTGWVVLGAGVLLLAVSTADRIGRRWLWGLTAGIVAAAVLLSVFVPSESVDPAGLTGSSADSVEIRNSNMQRQVLIRAALDPDKLSLFGNADADQLTAGAGTGNDSIDNAYLEFAASWGLVPAGAFVLIGVSLFAAVIRARKDIVASAVPAVALANFVGLMFVALITQQGFYIFALAGAAAAFDSRLHRSSR